MHDFYLEADRRHPAPLRPRCISESWTADPQDYVVQIALLFGRHVQVRRHYSRPSWLECVMFCRDPDLHWGVLYVAAEVAPNGDLLLHGGNRISAESSVDKLIDVFAGNAGDAYARGPL